MDENIKKSDKTKIWFLTIGAKSIYVLIYDRFIYFSISLFSSFVQSIFNRPMQRMSFFMIINILDLSLLKPNKYPTIILCCNADYKLFSLPFCLLICLILFLFNEMCYK